MSPEQVIQDLKYALRTMKRSPGFTGAAAATLALGIGAATAIFSVVNGVLLRPLPYPEPDRLVRVWEGTTKSKGSRNVVNAWNFLDWRERNRSFEGIAAVQSLTTNVTINGEPVALPGMQVSANFFSILRVPPWIGRSFAADDENAVILSYGLWQRRFGQDHSLIGR